MINIHTHSEYSKQDAISKVRDIALKEKELGYSSFAITDHGTFSSFPEAFQVAKELNMKFIPGIEMYLKPDDSMDLREKVLMVGEINKEIRKKTTSKEKKDELKAKLESINNGYYVKNFHLTLIAYNQTGLNNLFKIYSEGHLYYKHRITKESIINHKDGIIILSGCIAGELAFYVKTNQIEKAENLIKEYKSLFGENYFIEIMYHGIDSEKDSIKGFAKEFDTYAKIIDLAKKYDVPMIATNDSHYVNPEDEVMYGVYKSMCYYKSEDSKTGELGLHGTGYHIVSEDELKERFLEAGYDKESIISMFENVNKIDKKVEQGIDIESSNFLKDVMDELREKVIKCWEEKRKGTEYEKESWDRLNYELSVIKEKNFSNYFLKTFIIVDTAYKLNILTGPGRGSGAGSEIVYLLGITKVDPLKYHLLFERFLNPSRKGMPDIDNDIESEYIKEDGTTILGSEAIIEALQDVFKFHGRINNVVKGSSIVLFKKLASWCGVAFSHANKFTTSEIGIDILNDENIPSKEIFFSALKSLNIINDDNVKNWLDCYKYIDVCYKLRNIVFGSSIHASGVIMSEEESILPLNEENIIDFNGESIERYGYTKFDMLSLDTLNPIKYFYGIDVDWNDVYDEKVWDTICNGELDFVFQFSGFTPTEMCKKGKPRSIEKLGEINAINRPGPLNMKLNKTWIEIQNGNYEFTGNQKIIADILRKRFGEDHTGLLVYQEDVMFLCVDGAGFTLAEADDIRRAMGKKKTEIIKSYEKPFIDGWKALGTPGNPEEIWKDIVEFGKYAFNKSHAIAYSIVAYQTAKIWTYFKEEYLQWMINFGTKKRKDQAIKYCEKNNMNFIFPELNQKEDNLFSVHDNKLIFPLLDTENIHYYSDYLFSDKTKTEKLQGILHGVTDGLTKDRLGLYNLINNIPDDKLTISNFPQDNSLQNIINNGQLANLWNIKDEDENHWEVVINKPRATKKINICKHSDNISNDSIIFNIKSDLQNFGLIKPGLLSDYPFFDSETLFKKFYTLRNKLLNNSSVDELDKNTFYDYKRLLSNVMKEIFSNPYVNKKVDEIAKEYRLCYFVEAKLFKQYNYAKVNLRFDDGDHIFYVRNQDLENRFIALNKKSIIKVKLILECYINKNLEPTVVYSIKDIVD